MPCYHLQRFLLCSLLFCSLSITANAQTAENLPGAQPYSSILLNRIEKQKKHLPATYIPRTKHLTPDGKAKYTNRLLLESSPYLLQHAHNPVNWYAWGEEAFAAAAKHNLPIFLSIGYSTCHWCHVMEQESFEDIEIASFINKNFIAIKVDREERPDIDAIYMAALHAMGRSGGWPMNVWLTPNKIPFYGGTYFPARDGDRGSNMGLLTLLQRLKHIYDTQPDKIKEISKGLAQAIKINLQATATSSLANSKLPNASILHLAAAYYKDEFDEFYGGMGNAPKFPSTTPYQFLLRYYRRTGDKKILDIVQLSLTKMASGGIYDQVGGGFHRYSTDTEWLVPHFEKMLYDNALLAVDYLETYQLTHDSYYKNISKEILHYIQRDMTSPEGGFYSATDADSPMPSGHNEEGYFFTWDEKDFMQALGVGRAKLMYKYYGLSSNGNFKSRNILHTATSIADFSASEKIPIKKLTNIINESKQLLYQFRKKLPPPARDEKILVAWNGLMISAFAKAGLILNNKTYTQQAIKSAQFILDKLYINGRLFRSYKDNMAKHYAYLNDYAFFIAGLLDLYEASFDIKWMKLAIELDNILQNNYEDKINGGFYLTSTDHEQLIAREKPGYDGAEPSGNSVQILNLLRLAEFTSRDKYRKRAENSLKYFSSTLNNQPIRLSKMLLAVDFYYDSVKEVIIITNNNKLIDAQDLLASLRQVYLPNKVLSIINFGTDLVQQSKTIAIAEGKTAIHGKATAYVCEYGACELPTNNAIIFKKQISKITSIPLNTNN